VFYNISALSLRNYRRLDELTPREDRFESSPIGLELGNVVESVLPQLLLFLSIDNLEFIVDTRCLLEQRGRVFRYAIRLHRRQVEGHLEDSLYLHRKTLE